MTRIHDDHLLDTLVALIEAGNYIDTACAVAGITQTTYSRWLRVGREVEQRIALHDDASRLREALLRGDTVLDLSTLECRAWLFRSKIQLASARAEASALMLIRQQMPRDWLAAMSFLERRWPGRWRRRQAVEVESEHELPDGNIDVQALLVDPDAAALIHQALTIVASKDAKRELKRPIARELPDVKA